MSKVPFTVSAKTARLIGQENFSNAEGAVIELVKNCYDADSPIAIVVIDAPNDAIYIIDNGEGMTQDVIEEHWMTIGTSNKENNFLTGNKRVKTGAKGIGRFALDRLGNRCIMQTKMLNTEGVYWEIDWSEFGGNNKKINQVYAEIHAIKSFDVQKEIQKILAPFSLADNLFSDWKGNQGTIIQIRGIRNNDKWLAEWDNDKELISSTSDDLYNNLESLIPPLEKNYFKIFFFNTQLPNNYGEVVATDVEDYDYKLHAKVDDLGNANIKIWRNELELTGLERLDFFTQKLSEATPFKYEDFERGDFEIKTDISKILNKFKDTSGLLAKIGAFDFTFYYIRRGSGEEKEGEDPNVYPYKSVNFRDRKSWLDKFGGVKIFRDNFRIRPYGEPKSTSFDWLGMLGKGSGNSFVKGGWKVKANQAYGIVSISRIGNINFQDKSNREGLQENEVFQLFQKIIKNIIGFLEKDRNKVMKSLYELDKIRRKDEENLEIAKALAEEEAKRQENENNDENINVNKANYKSLTQAVTYQEKKIFELEEKQKMLQVLASAGLIVTSFSHELKSHKNKLVQRMNDLNKELKKIISDDQLLDMPKHRNPFIMIEDMIKVDERLKHWLEFALASVRKSKRNRRKIDMVKYIEELERSWSSLLSRRQITLTIDKREFLEVYFFCHEIDLDSIFNNLLSNSADFLKEKTSAQREIKISFSFDFNLGISVTYEDNGPGLSEEINDPYDIFEPFFTTKRGKNGEPTGTGLGMWIVKEIIDEYKGKIEFIHYRPGIKLKLHLPTK